MHTFEMIFYNVLVPRMCLNEYKNVKNFEYVIYLLVLIVNTFLSYWLSYMPLSFLFALSKNAEHIGRLLERLLPCNRLAREMLIKTAISDDVITVFLVLSSNAINFLHAFDLLSIQFLLYAVLL
jgi:hypothetical protein